jgi:histidine ammonia-lyase
LSPFLATAPGVESGMMIYQYNACGAGPRKHKVLGTSGLRWTPIPTSANQEDHVSMGSIAARHARLVLDGVQRIVSIELLVAAQALDLRLESMSTDGTGPAPEPGAGVAEASAADPP